MKFLCGLLICHYVSEILRIAWGLFVALNIMNKLSLKKKESENVLKGFTFPFIYLALFLLKLLSISHRVCVHQRLEILFEKDAQVKAIKVEIFFAIKKL